MKNQKLEAISYQLSASSKKEESTTTVRNPKSEIRNPFSLVELIAVISIIAILTSIVASLGGNAAKAAEESAMKTIIMQLDASIESYKNEVGSYPTFHNDGAMYKPGKEVAGTPLPCGAFCTPLGNFFTKSAAKKAIGDLGRALNAEIKTIEDGNISIGGTTEGGGDASDEIAQRNEMCGNGWGDTEQNGTKWRGTGDDDAKESYTVDGNTQDSALKKVNEASGPDEAGNQILFKHIKPTFQLLTSPNYKGELKHNSCSVWGTILTINHKEKEIIMYRYPGKLNPSRFDLWVSDYGHINNAAKGITN